MPWTESTKMDEKLKFVARFLDGESISSLCREFGISRVTGHKIIDRYKESGMKAFTDRSRKPFRQANRLPFQVEKLIVQLKKEFPTWGAPKIRDRISTHYPEIALPAKSTVHAILDRNGLVDKKRVRRHPRLQGTPLSDLRTPNALWCTDYKGEFMLGNKKYCYPLTVTDYSTRFLICCEGLESTRESDAFNVFERLFEEYGLPDNIRSDNGVPFACPNALYGLSSLSVWWLRLGIGIERIKPGHPQQNGRHERMHLTLKKATTKPPGMNMLQQQDKFEDFIQEFNYERPHQALEMKRPADLYQPSTRKYEGLPDISYPFHDKTVTITSCGRICIEGKKIHLSTVFAGQDVGLKQVEDDVWLVSFMNYDLAYFDLESHKVQALDNPFGPKVLTM
jgi:transposase InsO family protein